MTVQCSDLAAGVAVVTGAAGGIGRALATRFAQEGMVVVLVDVDEAALAERVAELTAAGATAEAEVCDVSDAAAVDQLAARIGRRHDAVHVLCNNAGLDAGAPFAEVDDATWDRVLGVDLFGVVHGCASFLPLLRRAPHAHVVNTASIAALNVYFPTGTPYVAAKCGVLGFSEWLRAAWSATEPSISVSVLCPGFVDTGMAARLPLDSLHPVRAAMVRHAVQSGARGIPAAQAADDVVAALRTGQLYVLTHGDEALDVVQSRVTWLAGGPEPEPPPGTLSARAAFAAGAASSTAAAPSTQPTGCDDSGDRRDRLEYRPALPRPDVESFGSAAWRTAVEQSLGNAIRCFRTTLPMLEAGGGGDLVTVLPAVSADAALLGSAATTARLALLGMAENLQHELVGMGSTVQLSLAVPDAEGELRTRLHHLHGDLALRPSQTV